jgi:hypothetical protein
MLYYYREFHRYLKGVIELISSVRSRIMERKGRKEIRESSGRVKNTTFNGE